MTSEIIEVQGEKQKQRGRVPTHPCLLHCSLGGGLGGGWDFDQNHFIWDEHGSEKRMKVIATVIVKVCIKMKMCLKNSKP